MNIFRIRKSYFEVCSKKHGNYEKFPKDGSPIANPLFQLYGPIETTKQMGKIGTKFPDRGRPLAIFLLQILLFFLGEHPSGRLLKTMWMSFQDNMGTIANLKVLVRFDIILFTHSSWNRPTMQLKHKS